MSLRRRTFTPALLGLLGLLVALATLTPACTSSPESEPRPPIVDPTEVVPPPTAHRDPALLRAYSATKHDVPLTVMSGETGEDLDLAWIRRSFALTIPLDAVEVAAICGVTETEEQRTSASVPDFPGDRIRVSDLSETQAEERRALRSSELRVDRLESERAAIPGRIHDLLSGERRSHPGPVNRDDLEFHDAAELAATPPDYPAPQLGLDLAEGRQRRPIAENQVARLANQGALINHLFASAESEASPSAPRAVLSGVRTPPRIGKVLIRGPKGAFESLVPRAMRVVVFVEGPRARTTVDLVFENPHDRRLQGTFYYSLPDGASPAAFGMFPGTRRVSDVADLATSSLLPALPLTGVTPGRLAALAPQRGLAASTDAQRRPFVSDWKPIQEARVVEQMRARQVYEQIVRKRVDPALLEWSGGNTFQARIFPIEARGLKRIVFTFEQTLPRAGDHLRYAFPLPGDVRLGDVELFVHTKNPDALELDLPPLAGVLREPSGTPIDTDDWTRLRFVAPKGFSGALDLAFDAPGPQILTGPIPGLEGQALFARVRPQIPDRESTVPTGKALFLVDTSLSEEGVRRALASELLLEVLKRDPTISEYAVLLFDVRPRWLHAKTYRKNTPAARAETRAELAKIYLEGATNFAGLLGELASEASWTDAGKPAARFLLSDGLITWGNDKVDVLLSRHPQALKGPWFTYRFGDVAVNGALFAKLSRLSEGRTVNVLSAEQLPAAAIAHRKVPVRLEAVRLEGGHEFVVAGDPELVFPGQTLDVAARFAPGEKPSHLEVVLEIEGVRHLQRIPVQTGSSVLAARAWAELWVGRLLALDDERLQRRVVALSQAFGLANKAASLLILEDDAEWVAHELETEPLDLAHFAGLRAAEESGRLDLLQGIQMDSVSEDGRALVLALLRSKLPPLQRGLPLMDRPLAGGLKRLTDEVSYRKARSADALDVKAYDRIARARAIAGDTCGAVRGLSCVVEKRPRSAEANRLVGYACLALGQYGPAAELFERVRLTRPFEGQSFLEEALALEALGRFGEAARNFEIVLARSFPRDQAQIRTTARYHYARMLADLLLGGGIEGELEARLTARKAGLETKPGEFARTALQLSIHWNTDGTDVDLWVVEPEGERCYFSNRSTKAGGRLFWDTTTGYGPELYRRVQCEAEGSFDVLLHYYGNNGQRWEVPTAVLCVRDFDVFGTQGPSRRQFKMRILPKSSAVIRLGRERP